MKDTQWKIHPFAILEVLFQKTLVVTEFCAAWEPAGLSCAVSAAAIEPHRANHSSV
jgi:hypothetical protein